MSLRGRHVIDRLKKSVSGWVRLPVPPYQNPSYWEGVYRQLGPDDVFEWGSLSFQDLNEYSYQLVDEKSQPLSDGGVIQTNLHETLAVQKRSRVPSNEADRRAYNEDDEPILMLGCGNSKLGEDLLASDLFAGPVIQVDISSRVVQALSHRCARWQETGDMQLIQDDATVLSAIDDNKIAAVLDKGLLDALYCADQHEQCTDIMKAVHRVLRPNGILATLSFSRPEFLLPTLVSSWVFDAYTPKAAPWDSVEVRRLDSIFLYRFEKASKDIRKPSRKLKRR